MVVDEAHRMGYRMCAHCEGLAGTELAIEAGVDTIEHGMYLNQRPDLLEQMAVNDQVLVPTLSFLLHVVAGDESTDTAPLHAGANELLRMIEAGLSAHAALVAATSGAPTRLASPSTSAP